MSNTFIYLASPYSHPLPAVRQARYEAVCRYIANWQMRCSPNADMPVIYSPIAHWHPTARRHSMPTDHDFWRPTNFALLRHASVLHILRLPGWERSLGIAAERGFATGMNIYTQLVSYEPATSEEEDLLNTD